jgi:hypothetical protein
MLSVGVGISVDIAKARLLGWLMSKDVSLKQFWPFLRPCNGAKQGWLDGMGRIPFAVE